MSRRLAIKLWWNYTVGKDLARQNLSYKFKALILTKCFKQKGSGLNLERAYLRWNVFGLKIRQKKAVQKFALYGRINKQTLMWRFRKAFL